MTIGSILTALAAIPQIVGYLESFASAVSLWYISRQTTANLAAIANAADLAATAKTDEERYAAALAWKNALSNTVVSSS
jgi:hypothetical protein